jgi:hypothetical protein
MGLSRGHRSPNLGADIRHVSVGDVKDPQVGDNAALGCRIRLDLLTEVSFGVPGWELRFMI